MAVLTSAAGQSRTSTNQSSPPSLSPNDLMACNNCATICASSKVTDCLNATDPATLTASPQRGFKSRCYFCSSTNGCADHLPTAASTAVRTLKIAQTADLKPPTTAPTRPSRTSSICSPPRDGATSLLESSCLTSPRLESNASPPIAISVWASVCWVRRAFIPSLA